MAYSITICIEITYEWHWFMAKYKFKANYTEQYIRETDTYLMITIRRMPWEITICNFVILMNKLIEKQFAQSRAHNLKIPSVGNMNRSNYVKSPCFYLRIVSNIKKIYVNFAENFKTNGNYFNCITMYLSHNVASTTRRVDALITSYTFCKHPITFNYQKSASSALFESRLI